MAVNGGNEKRPIDRLREYIADIPLTDSAFEKTAGLSNGYVNKSDIGSGGLGSEILNKIHRAFPDLSLSWVITGEGDKETKQYRVSQNSEIVLREPPVIYSESKAIDNLIRMPVMDMQFAAGASAYTPDYLETIDHVFIPKAWLKKGKNYACGRIRGDSMAPTLLDGGYGIIRLLDKGEWANMPNEEVFVVVSKDGTHANAQLKRVKNRLDKGFIVMMSDNPDKASNPNFNIQADEMVGVWHLDWYFTSRMPNIHSQYYSRLQTLEDRFEDLINEIKPIRKLK